LKQRGAVEACWAHNPEVGGSKPLAANLLTVRISIVTLHSTSKEPGAVEACWAHNPEVGGSKPLAANIFITAYKEDGFLDTILKQFRFLSSQRSDFCITTAGLSCIAF
uniref:ELYS-bb domain-containing protein n=1 Tax=Angiostrongylus costaricensis TaxID=334426 RepID=A0A0R3Q2W2_ANGCS